MQCGAQEEAAKLGVTVNTQGPQKFDPTLQKPILDSIVAGRPDALLVAPTDVQAMQQPLQQAAAAGIKVVLVDTTTNDPSYAVSAIASDNEGGGKAAFDAIKQLHPERRQGHGDGRRSRHLDHRRARQGLRGRRQGRRQVQLRRRAVQPRRPGDRGPTHRRAAAEGPRPRRRLRRRTCSPPRARPPASSRRARAAR